MSYLREVVGYDLADGELAAVEGVLVPFCAQRDAYGNTWGPETDFGLSQWTRRPLFNEHDFALAGAAGYLPDEAITVQQDGLHGIGVLYDSDEGRAFLAAVRSGRAGFSTGCLPHKWKADASGFVRVWHFVEASQTVRPAAPGGTTRIKVVAGSIRSESFQEGLAVADQEQAQQEGVDVKAAAAQAVAEAAREIAGAIRATAQEAPARALPAGGAKPGTIVVRSKWDDVPLGPMLFMHEMALGAGMRGAARIFDEQYYRAVADKARKASEADEARVRVWEEHRQAPPAWIRSVDQEAYAAWHAKVPYLRTDEAMAVGLSGYGSNLVPTLFDSVAWHDISGEAPVFARLPSFVMPGNPYTATKFTTGPTIRKVPEFRNEAQATAAASNIPDSKAATSAVTWTAGGIGGLVLFSQELIEESAIDFVQELYNQFISQIAHGIDWTLLHGDETASTANIAHYGTDPTGTAYDSCLILDGLRHLAFDNSDTVAVATVADTQFAAARKLMGVNGVLGYQASKLIYLCDIPSYYAIGALSSIKTLDLVGPMATVLTGDASFCMGIAIVPSVDYELTNASGQVEDSHDTTKGSGLVVRPDLLKVGLMRQVNIQVQPIVGTTGYAAWGTVRLDLQQMQAGGVAMIYNQTV